MLDWYISIHTAGYNATNKIHSETLIPLWAISLSNKWKLNNKYMQRLVLLAVTQVLYNN